MKSEKYIGDIIEDFEWKYSQEGVDWNELSELYKVVPMADMTTEELKKVFTISMFKCFVFESNKLVGVGRALADGVDCSYICHIAVLPNYQQPAPCDHLYPCVYAHQPSPHRKPSAAPKDTPVQRVENPARRRGVGPSYPLDSHS